MKGLGGEKCLFDVKEMLDVAHILKKGNLRDPKKRPIEGKPRVRVFRYICRYIGRDARDWGSNKPDTTPTPSALAKQG